MKRNFSVYFLIVRYGRVSVIWGLGRTASAQQPNEESGICCCTDCYESFFADLIGYLQDVVTYFAEKKGKY